MTTTSFLWDTDTVSDGSNYIFKVEASNTEGLISEFITNPTITIQNHILSSPTINAPKGGEVLTGTVEIQWTASIDSKSHTLTYTVYYSVNGGSWIQLATNLTMTSLSWDTTTDLDSTNYLIKVVSTCSEGLTSEDTSDATFTVQNTIPTTTTTTPSTTTSTTSSTTTTITSTTTSTTTTTETRVAPGWIVIATILAIGALTVLKRK